MDKLSGEKRHRQFSSTYCHIWLCDWSV